MTKLFCSFTSILRLVNQKQIADNELNQGLYAFGCTREHVFSQVHECHEATWQSDDESVQNYLSDKIKELVTEAESSGRVVFRTLEEGNMSFDKVSSLLERNGLQPLGTVYDTYCYPRLKELVEQKNPTVEVLF